jgi:hypothetical protein
VSLWLIEQSGDGRKDEAIATLISEIILATKEVSDILIYCTHPCWSRGGAYVSCTVIFLEAWSEEF